MNGQPRIELINKSPSDSKPLYDCPVSRPEEAKEKNTQALLGGEYNESALFPTPLIT